MQILRNFDVRFDCEDRHHDRTFRISHICFVDLSEKVIRGQFHQCFYPSKSQKSKKLLDLAVFFSLLGSARVKAGLSICLKKVNWLMQWFLTRVPRNPWVPLESVGVPQIYFNSYFQQIWLLRVPQNWFISVLGFFEHFRSASKAKKAYLKDVKQNRIALWQLQASRFLVNIRSSQNPGDPLHLTIWFMATPNTNFPTLLTQCQIIDTFERKQVNLAFLIKFQSKMVLKTNLHKIGNFFDRPLRVIYKPFSFLSQSVI